MCVGLGNFLRLDRYNAIIAQLEVSPIAKATRHVFDVQLGIFVRKVRTDQVRARREQHARQMEGHRLLTVSSVRWVPLVMRKAHHRASLAS